MTAVALTTSAISGLGRRLDPVVAAMGLGLLLLAVLSPSQAAESLEFTVAALWGIAPYLLVAIALASYAVAAGLDQLVGQAFGGRMDIMIVAAAVFGALSPFCSCGVIPVIAALLAVGVPLPAVMAFWVSSPIMDPEMYIVTAAGLNVEFATAKTLAAIVLGLGSGFATLGLQRLGAFASPLREHITARGDQAVREPRPARWAVWQEPGRRVLFARMFRKNGFFLGKWLALAFLLESLMLAYLPAEAVGYWLGSDNLWAIPGAAVVGVPAYLNGYAAIPTVGALMELGMSQGAGLAFMIAGAVTSIPAAIAVFALVKRLVFAWYILLALVGATASGLAYQGWGAI